MIALGFIITDDKQTNIRFDNLISIMGGSYKFIIAA